MIYIFRLVREADVLKVQRFREKSEQEWSYIKEEFQDIVNHPELLR